MTQWLLWWALLVGPVYLALWVALYLARHFFPEEQILFELSESTVIIAAAAMTAAAAGLLVQVV
jgi:hypothetical protein